MANEELVRLIKKGAVVWNRWRAKNSDLPVDLSGINLNAVDLGEASLSLVDLKRTDLSGANLGKADLRKADLRGASLNGANLVKAYLSAAKLRRASFVWTNLRNANLSGADLMKGDLSCADLRQADLSKTTLRFASLRKADLRNAILIGADLRGADVSGADLTQAFLSSADLRDTNLDDANLEEATIGGTTFGSNDLSNVKGLETVSHIGPSTIGVDTLFKSDGKIPAVFLRGSGMPEVFITYFPSLISQPIEFYSCFISYSHADKSFARRLHDSLQGRGIRCWLDEHQLLPGDKLYTEVDRGIRLWDKVLLCCSKDALTSWWVDNEIKIAFDKEQKLRRQRGKEILALIPLNLDDYLFSGLWESGLATEVQARLAANFSGWEGDNRKFEKEFELLVKALRTGSRGKEPPPPNLL